VGSEDMIVPPNVNLMIGDAFSEIDEEKSAGWRLAAEARA
jgi:hypothetical protein